MLSPERIAAATARLDPEDRALVELFARRGMGAADIGDVLGIDAAEVERRHEAALGRLADELGTTAADVRRSLAPEEEPDEPVTTEAPAVATARPDAKRQRSIARRTEVLAIALAIVVVAIGLAIVVAATGGGGSGTSSEAGTTAAGTGTGGGNTTAAAEPPAGPVRTLQRLNGTNGRGTAQLRRAGSRTRLRVTFSGFLQPVGGGYAIWLYNSIADSRRLYATTATAIRREFTLPPNYTRYRYAEVARAVPALNSPHSGLSLLRVKVSSLERP